jgi:hypothetical protein
MVWQRTRFALLAGAIVAVAAHTARAAEEAKPAPVKEEFCTIKVTECVPETYTATRTVYKMVSREEKYTAYKCESVPVEQTRTCTVYKRVAEVKTVNRNYWVCTPVVEEKTVLRPCYSTRQVTKMVCKTEDHGHYECREVPCHWKACAHKLRHCCRKSDCCEPCCPPPTRTKKVWVPCKVTVQVPVTVCERVCEMKPVVCKVCTYKRELKTEACQVTCWKCVPETRVEKYTCLVTRRVPYQATRTVCVCVPHEEKVTCTRMVARVVEKKVPVVTACASPCEAEPCCCPSHKCHRHKLHRHNHCCD